MTERFQQQDGLARALEWGLILIVVTVPLLFGAVGAGGRLTLELGAALLGLAWLARALRHSPVLPRWGIRVGLVGLTLLCAFQAIAIGSIAVRWISPRSLEIRESSVPDGPALAAETRILGRDPSEFDATPALSVDPPATASALRTGAALGILLLVSTTVAATRGCRRLALALLVSAGFQGLYGVLVLASGHDRIWHVPKVKYLDSATGTFINQNHYACFLVMCCTTGLGLILSRTRRTRSRRGGRIVDWFGAEGSRDLLLVLALLLGLAGLFTSFSRAGILLGIAAILATFVASSVPGRLRPRLLVAGIVIAVALVPLARIGPERLHGRYSDSVADFVKPGGRATVWLDTIAMAGAFPLVGTGFGTFATSYPLFRSPEVRLFYSHTHNDLLQAVAEGGLIGLVLLGILLVPVLRTIAGAVSGRQGPLVAGIGCALAAVLVHGLIDFNFHIPANAALAAVLAGSLEGLHCSSPPSS